MARYNLRIATILLVLSASIAIDSPEAGIIKDIYQKVTNTNNKTEDTVKASVPVCGSGVFSTPDEASLSPEIIFISTRPSRIEGVRQKSGSRNSQQTGHKQNTDHSGVGNDNRNDKYRDRDSGNRGISEVSKEFKFHADNVTVEELMRYGFNPRAPVSFLIHGFTSGYPLQAWLSAIVEAYTIDRETSGSSHSGSTTGHGTSSGYDSYRREKGTEESSYSSGNRETATDNGEETYENHPSGASSSNSRDYGSSSRRRNNYQRDSSTGGVTGGRERDGQRNRTPIDNNRQYEGTTANANANHNLFIVNWNYAARGILYPRAVANIPIVASYVTRFINNKLIDDARVDPNRIQLIGHSLGAHLAGFIGKNTRSKLGRIYGLDPAGPCFGTVAGPLYPASKRLAPTDAREVITIQTNSALLGIDKPLGKYSVFVEGGANQPGCKPSGVLKSLGTLTWDGGDFDTVACSHSRAPNLLTYRYDQNDAEDECQMVAYACKDWQSFLDGHCGVCDKQNQLHDERRQGKQSASPFNPVECYRIGLDWQYPASSSSSRPATSSSSSFSSSTSSPWSSSNSYEQYENVNDGSGSGHSSSSIIHNNNKPNRHYSSTRRPSLSNYNNEDSDSRDSDSNYSTSSSSSSSRRHVNSTIANAFNQSNLRPDQSRDRQRRDTNDAKRYKSRNSTEPLEADERRSKEDSIEPVKMFLKTGDTQPYCTFHYQVILELNEPFGRRKPPMSIILQDSEPDRASQREQRRGQLSSGQRKRGEQNSLSSDEFGNKFNDKLYTHLLTSSKKLQRIDHATMIFRDGLQDGHRQLKAIYVNYMSHSDKKVRDRLSSRLCPVKADEDRQTESTKNNRFYFKPCERRDRDRDQHTGDSSISHSRDREPGSYSSSSSSNSKQKYGQYDRNADE